MRIAKDWQEYQIIDTSDNEKLEKWGDITLIRPDPQIIWKSEHKSPLWNTPHAHYHRSNQGGGAWEYKKKMPESWTIDYKGIVFNIKPTGFKHTGLFRITSYNVCYTKLLRITSGSNSRDCLNTPFCASISTR